MSFAEWISLNGFIGVSSAEWIDYIRLDYIRCGIVAYREGRDNMCDCM